MAMEEALVSRLRLALRHLLAKDGFGLPAVSWFGPVRGDALPSLSLTKISPGRSWTHSGPDGLDRPRVQFDCRARSETEVVALARALTAEMERTVEAGGWRFHEAEFDGERWISEGEQDGGQKLFRIQLDFLFFHERI